MTGPASDDPVRSRLSAPQRRAQLLTVARKVLSDRGYHATTMSDIAVSAGVTKPVLYQHFASKRDLYRTVLEDIGSRLRAAVVDSASAAPTPRARAEAGIQAFTRFVELDYEGFRLLFDGTNRHDPEWSEIIRSVERSLASAVAALIDVPTIAESRRLALAHGVIGLAESMMRYAGTGPSRSIDHEQLVRDLTALTWSGLRGLEG